MKNSWRLLLALLASFALVAAACGSDSDDTDASGDGDSTETTAESTDETTEETTVDLAADFNLGLTYDIGGRGDQSFNDSAAAGADRASTDFGVTVSEAEPNADGSDRAQLLQLQADSSALVVAVGFLFGGDVVAVAAENPDVNFAVVDDAMLDFDRIRPFPLATTSPDSPSLKSRARSSSVPQRH